MRKTKIICTLGPAVDDENIMEGLFLHGMDVARVNFSHGDYEEHKTRIEKFKKIRNKLGMPIPLLLDTRGPEIRLGKFKEKEIELKEGDKFTLVCEDEEYLGDKESCSVSYKNLYKDVRIGGKILINDGLIELEIQDIVGKRIHCVVLNGGFLSNNKGVNVPEAEINLPSLTEKDISDLIFGIENDFDIIAASFVRKALDIIEIKKVLEKHNGKDMMVIAKIENREGIRNFEEIVKVADGIMIARGDLGVEIPVQEVPIMQKMMIEKCIRQGKPVITATQMLDSMIRNPRPTRAEASDVANAIYDGTSVIMLSGETAAGKYPIEALKTMSSIAVKAEESIDYWGNFSKATFNMHPSITNAISHATCTTALDLKASAIIAVTQTGTTARMISRFRPQCPIIATTVSEIAQRQLSLSWGVYPYLVKEATSTDELFSMGVDKALESKLVREGDIVVITAGVPIGVSGTTNILKVHLVGDVLVQGTVVNKGKIIGEICVIRSPEEAAEKFINGCILVAPFTNNNMIPYIKNAKGLIVEEGGIDSHAAVVGLALDIPVIVGADNAVKILKTGSVVTMDADRGIVRNKTNF